LDLTQCRDFGQEVIWLNSKIAFLHNLESYELKEYLFVSHKYPPSTGGMQKQSFELITNVSKEKSIHKILFRSNYPKIIFFLSITIRAYLKVLSNKEIKLVHANDGLMALFLTPLLSIKRIQLCATIHGLDVVFNFSAYQWWVRRYLSRFSFLITVSEATREECIDRGIRAERVFYIPNAVELPEKTEKNPEFAEWLHSNFGRDIESKFLISSVGRPVPRKGFGWFAKEILPQLPNTCYIVVGTKIDSSWVISLLKALLPKRTFEKACIMLGVPLENVRLAEIAKDNEQLILPGKVPYDQLIQTYLHSSLFVMPTKHVAGAFEGFGLVALEAGSLGAVCLAADVDGIPSAIKDGENGFLLESENKEEWIQKIKSLQETAALKHAQDRFKPHYETKQTTWQDMSEQYVKLFDQQLSQGFGQPS